MSADQTFTAAMVQMCSGLLPEANLEQGTKLIRQAVADRSVAPSILGRWIAITGRP